MITEHDLQEAIAECKGQRNPTANTCIKLAAFYIIRDKLYPAPDEKSMDHEPVFYSSMTSPVNYTSNSEFGKILDHVPLEHVLSVVDELMDTVKVLNPRLYDSVIRRLTD